jgi:esterase/lipase superfamily enzyme
MDIDPNLPRDIFGWHSPRLGIDMPIVRYGTWGHALLLYPTANSDLYDAEKFGLIRAIEHHIFAGKVTVFSINTVNSLSWMNESIDGYERGRRQALFSGYVEEEVVPHIRRALQNDSARIGVCGASFGAFHAANSFFRRPDLFDTLVAMSGFYDLSPSFTRGASSDEIYFNNPMSFVPNLNDEHMLHLMKHASQIHITTGQGAYEAPHASKRFSQVLWDKGIWHNLDMWGHDVPHDWPTWHRMLNHYLSERLGW